MLDPSSFAVATGMAAVAVTTKEVTPVTERETSRPLTRARLCLRHHRGITVTEILDKSVKLAVNTATGCIFDIPSILNRECFDERREQDPKKRPGF